MALKTEQLQHLVSDAEICFLTAEPTM